jgi:hypothetical protein
LRWKAVDMLNLPPSYSLLTPQYFAGSKSENA